MSSVPPVDYPPTPIEVQSATMPKPSKALFITGWVITTLIILWMGVMGIVIMLTNPEMMKKGMAEMGYPDNVAVPIFVAELLSVLLYAIPRTAVLGAILLTGYLGGAVDAHVHAGQSFQWLMPVAFGVLVWLGVLCREPRMRWLLPIRR
jgi:hypothetical protein